YDAAALGNHEFDFGPVGPSVVPRAPGDDPRGVIKVRAAEAKFPWITSNIRDHDGRPPGAPTVRTFTIVEVAGIKVGLVGGTSEDTPRATARPNLVGLTFDPLSDGVARATAEARKAGATVVVALVHAGGDCPPPSRLTDTTPFDGHGCDDAAEVFMLARRMQA